MEFPPSLDLVIDALNALYRGESPEGKEKANLWLGELQNSIYAWQISDQILLTSLEQEHCYFAAQTMRTKIQYHFNELPESSYESLKNSLLLHCSKIVEETPHSITTQLCLALADLALQLTSWDNPTKDLLQKYAVDRSKWRFLMEFITVFPEEVNSRALRLGKNRKNEIIAKLTDIVDLFLTFLLMVHSERGHEEPILQLIIQCLGSWLFEITPRDLNSSFTQILELPFLVMKNPNSKDSLHKAASECICSALISVENYKESPQLAQYLLVEVLKLSDAYVAISSVNHYSEKCSDFSRIFAENAETFLPAILNDEPIFSDMRSVELLLYCLNNPNYEVVDVTFTFWNRLTEMISDNQKYKEMFKPHLKRVVLSLAILCRFEHDTMDGILTDNSDDFMDFRSQCSQLVDEITLVLGASTIFSELYQQIQTCNGTWESLEAAIFLLGSAAKFVLDEESSNPIVIEEVCKIVLQINMNHLTLRHTCLKFLQQLHEFFKTRPEYIHQVIVYTSNSINEPRLSLIATSTIEILSIDCYKHMQAYLEDLVKGILTADFNTPNESINNLLKACGHIISGIENHDHIKQVLLTICTPITQNLSQILRIENASIDFKNKLNDPGIWLDRYASLLRSINIKVLPGEPHPCQDIINHQIWPSIEECFIKYKTHAIVIEKVCRATRFVVRCLGLASIPLLPSLMKQIVDIFYVYHHSCCLYLGSILIDEYATAKDASNQLILMFQALITPTFTILNQPGGSQNYPDIVDDMFRLGHRMLRRLPDLLLHNPTFRPLLRSAIQGISLDHKTAHESITKFITAFIDVASGGEKNLNPESLSLAVQALEESGQDIIDYIIKAALFYLPKSLFEDLAEIFFKLLSLNNQIVCQWLEKSFNTLPQQRASATPQQLLEFHQAIMTSKKDLEIEEHLRTLSRLYR